MLSFILHSSFIYNLGIFINIWNIFCIDNFIKKAFYCLKKQWYSLCLMPRLVTFTRAVYASLS